MTRLILLLSLALATAFPVRGDDDLQALVTAGLLSIDSEVTGAEQLVPGQRAQLVLKVATSNWFTGGTRIRIPEVPGLVILQTEQFAANASEVRQGQTWVIQRWTLDLYPQRKGEFTIPPIPVRLKVNGGEPGALEGELLSPPAMFSVSVPAALEQADFWVAAPRFSVEQSLDRETDALQPGDAFTRRIVFSANDVQAMMLPTIDAEQLPGLASYPAPAQMSNSNNRGVTNASRTETISYIAEAPGDYLLPARDFFWWNTQTGELEILSLPAITVQVAGEMEVGATAADRSALIRNVVIAAAAVLLALLLYRLLNRWQPWSRMPALFAALDGLRQTLRRLRQPALAQKLNPDNSAAE